MSVSPSANFISNMIAADQNMIFVASKFPNKGIESFEIDQNGRFEIIYNKDYEGTPSNSSDKNLNEQMNSVSVKVNRQVTGQIDAENKTVTIDPGCVVASTTKKFIPINISLTKVKAVSEKTLEISAKWGVFPEKAVSVTNQWVQFTNIAWKG